MKKATLIITLFIIVINSASAQFTVGPKVGMNLSKEYYGLKLIDEDIDFRAGLNAGFFGKYKIKEKIDIQTELLYSQQGYKDNIPSANVGWYIISGGYKILSHYINIPVVIKYYYHKSFYVEAGPQIGFCLGSRMQHNEEYIDEVIKMDYKTADFSIVGGLGFDIGNMLSVNARYNHGLTNTAPQSDLKNRVIQISLAYNLWSF